MRPEDEDLFWTYVSITEASECWEWRGNKMPRGYGLFYMEGRHRYAHRLAYELATGRSPEGLFVRHSCDNPPCVNAWHLDLGTVADNNRDMAARKRSPHGSAHWNSRLNEAQVAEMMAQYRAGGVSQKAVAAAYGVSQAFVSRAVTGKTWAHVV